MGKGCWAGRTDLGCRETAEGAVSDARSTWRDSSQRAAWDGGRTAWDGGRTAWDGGQKTGRSVGGRRTGPRGGFHHNPS
ncbi:hypothetical protein GCM10018771_62100 [Streptomyces cellulosae]|nr:hypothetical protein GCM10018771_62100 [Streptomyces cellulosae]